MQELLSRTSLETQKLDLMTEVSELKLKLVGMEKEQREQEEKQRKAEVGMIHQILEGPITVLSSDLGEWGTGRGYPNMDSGHLVNPNCGSHWVPEISMH